MLALLCIVFFFVISSAFLAMVSQPEGRYSFQLLNAISFFFNGCFVHQKRLFTQGSSEKTTYGLTQDYFVRIPVTREKEREIQFRGGWIETFEQCFARAQKQDFQKIYKLMWETGKTVGLGPNSTHAVRKRLSSEDPSLKLWGQLIV